MRLIGYLGRLVASMMLPTQVVSRLSASRGEQICLTFDDGPHADHTPRILDILARREIHATFFFTGQLAEEMPDLVRAAHAQGHGVANHGYHHLRVGEVPHDDYMLNVERGQQVLETILGQTLPRVFRPPYGSVGVRQLLALLRANHRIVLWTVDSEDSWLRDPDAVVAAVIGAPLNRGSIVLLHEDYEWTVRALPLLIEAIFERGLCPAPLLDGKPLPTAVADVASPRQPGRQRCA